MPRDCLLHSLLCTFGAPVLLPSPGLCFLLENQAIIRRRRTPGD